MWELYKYLKMYFTKSYNATLTAIWNIWNSSRNQVKINIGDSSCICLQVKILHMSLHLMVSFFEETSFWGVAFPFGALNAQ